MNAMWGRKIETWLVVTLAGVTWIGVAMVLLAYAGTAVDAWIRLWLFLGAVLAAWGWRMRTVTADSQPAYDGERDVDAQIRSWAARWW